MSQPVGSASAVTRAAAGSERAVIFHVRDANEDDNLQRVWTTIDEQGLRTQIEKANPGLAGLPAMEASAQVIRTWIQANQPLMQRMTELQLDHRGLTCIPWELGLCTGLRELRLPANQLSSLPQALFHGMPALEVLDLSRNKIESLPEGIFQEMPALRRLDLDDNQIASLPEGIFQRTTALQTLILADNRLASVPDRLFRGLSSLGYLRLSFNELDYVPERLLHGLTALRTLSFTGNRLTSLPAGLFQELPALEKVYLNDNRLSSLPEGIFRDLAALNELYINDNRLVSLPKDLFSGTPTLWQHWFFNNPRLLPFYTDLPVLQNNIDPLRRVMYEFFTYEPQTPFARFYQFAGGGASHEAVKQAFAALPNPIKNAIYGKVWVEAGSPDQADPQWGERHVFDDMQTFYGALKRCVREDFEALDGGQKNAVYGRVYDLARGQKGAEAVNFKDRCWGENHAFGNILRLIEAMNPTVGR